MDILKELGISIGGGRKRKSSTGKARLRKKAATLKKLQKKLNSPKYKAKQAMNEAIAKADKLIAEARTKLSTR